MKSNTIARAKIVNPLISIAISTCNRSSNILEQLFQSIKKQKYVRFEIIVADQSKESLDRGQNSILCKKYGAQYFDLSDAVPSLPATRNFLVTKCNNEIVLFLDDDVELIDDVCLIKIISVFKQKEDAIGVGIPAWFSDVKRIPLFLIELKKFFLHLIFSFDLSNSQKITWYFHNVDMYLPPKGPVKVDWIHGYAMAFKKDIFSKVLFDEKLQAYAIREDIDFCFRAKKFGALYLTPEAKIIHKEEKSGRINFKKRLAMELIYWYYLYNKNYVSNSRFVGILYSLTILLRFLIKSIISLRIDGFIECFLAYNFFISHMKEIESLNLDFFYNLIIK